MNLDIELRNKKEAGSCNFCNERNYSKVLEVSGKHNGCVVVRFCSKCLKELLSRR